MENPRRPTVGATRARPVGRISAFTALSGRTGSVQSSRLPAPACGLGAGNLLGGEGLSRWNLLGERVFLVVGVSWGDGAEAHPCLGHVRAYL